MTKQNERSGAETEPERPRALVSVVIPCFNQAHFLGEAIGSVLSQNHSGFEVIVVDDGSSDDTREVAVRYPSQVKYLYQENRGLAAARNAGVRCSNGSHLVFLDADDRLLPNALASGLAQFEAHPECAFVAGAHRLIAADGTPLPSPERTPVRGDHYLSLLRGNRVAMHATVMYRSDALRAAGGFDESLPACEDYDLYLRLARTSPIHFHDELVAEYRRHDGNMSRDTALMLRTSLAVLRSQWQHVSGSIAARKAYARGIRAWQAYYAHELFAEVRSCLRSSLPLSVKARALATLIRRHPVWTAKRGLRRLHLRLGQRRAAPRPPGETPPVGQVRFGDLRRLTPISRRFGYDRGLPIDRYYIEGFLERHASDIRGRVMEVGDSTYTRRFGASRVSKADVLHVSNANPNATLVGDLATGEHLPSEAFDCVILTQTLHLIYDVSAALKTLHRILRPGGVLLLTVPGISQIEDGEWAETWQWSFSRLSVRRACSHAFPGADIEVESHGNVLVAISFLEGLATEELRKQELDAADPLYQLVITCRAVKAQGAE